MTRWAWACVKYAILVLVEFRRTTHLHTHHFLFPSRQLVHAPAQGKHERFSFESEYMHRHWSWRLTNINRTRFFRDWAINDTHKHTIWLLVSVTSRPHNDVGGCTIFALLHDTVWLAIRHRRRCCCGLISILLLRLRSGSMTHACHYEFRRMHFHRARECTSEPLGRRTSLELGVETIWMWFNACLWTVNNRKSDVLNA